MFGVVSSFLVASVAAAFFRRDDNTHGELTPAVEPQPTQAVEPVEPTELGDPVAWSAPTEVASASDSVFGWDEVTSAPAPLAAAPLAPHQAQPAVPPVSAPPLPPQAPTAVPPVSAPLLPPQAPTAAPPNENVAGPEAAVPTAAVPGTAAVDAANVDLGPGGLDGPADAGDHAPRRMLDDAQIASLVARQDSSEPTPHPIRPHELWHPTINLGPLPAQPGPASPTLDLFETPPATDRPARSDRSGPFDRPVDDRPGAAVVEPIAIDEPTDTGRRSILNRLRPVGGKDDTRRDDRYNDGFPTALGNSEPPLVPGDAGDIGRRLLAGPVGRSREMGGRGLRGPLPVLGMTPNDLDHAWIRGTAEPTAGDDGRFAAVQVSATPPGLDPAPTGRADASAAAEPDPTGDLTLPAAPEPLVDPVHGQAALASPQRPVGLEIDDHDDIVDGFSDHGPGVGGDEPSAHGDIDEGPDDGPTATVHAIRSGLEEFTPAPDIPDTYLAVRPLWIDPDGVVPTERGSVRVSHHASSSARAVDGAIEVDVEAGWCWARVDIDGPPVTLSLGEDTVRLTVPRSTIALAAVDDGDAKLVVVLTGEAVLVHSEGRMRLRSGAMVFLAPGADPQVDVAADEELRNDPVVSHNLALDAAR